MTESDGHTTSYTYDSSTASRSGYFWSLGQEYRAGTCCHAASAISSMWTGRSEPPRSSRTASTMSVFEIPESGAERASDDTAAHAAYTMASRSRSSELAPSADLVLGLELCDVVDGLIPRIGRTQPGRERHLGPVVPDLMHKPAQPLLGRCNTDFDPEEFDQVALILTAVEDVAVSHHDSVPFRVIAVPVDR